MENVASAHYEYVPQKMMWFVEHSQAQKVRETGRRAPLLFLHHAVLLARKQYKCDLQNANGSWFGSFFLQFTNTACKSFNSRIRRLNTKNPVEAWIIPPNPARASAMKHEMGRGLYEKGRGFQFNEPRTDWFVCDSLRIFRIYFELVLHAFLSDREREVVKCRVICSVICSISKLLRSITSHS